MQKTRIPLLRLGRQFQRHEVHPPSPLKTPPPQIPPHTNPPPFSAFLTHLLPTFTRALPTIEMHVSPRPHTHPVIRAHYINGRAKAICVRNMEMEQVEGKARVLAEAGGEKNGRVRGGRVVGSLNEGVRGVWDPFHGAGDGGRVLVGRGRGR